MRFNRYDVNNVTRYPQVVARLSLMVLLAGSIAWMPAPAVARATPDSFADVIEDILPAVVDIVTTQKVAGRQQEAPNFEFAPGSPFRDFFEEFNRRRREGTPRQTTSLGSGFIIDPDGLVVTNNHVVEGAESITVRLNNGARYDATIVGRDEKTDLALLKVESKSPLPSVTWGDSDVVRVGDWAIAIGNPMGLGGTVTVGIISARQRDINSGPYDDYFQTDAAINRGNSGGPLFNVDGKVIGINTAIFSQSGGSIGIGFAVSSSLAQNVIGQLRKFGSTRRGWLGVQIQAVTEEIADSLGLKKATGALVGGVLKDSPAAAAGIKTGDIILLFDNKPVADQSRLPRMVAETDVGKNVVVKVWRDGREVGLSVNLGELEKVDQASLTSLRGGDDAPDTRESIDELGMSMAGLTSELAEKFQLDGDTEGVVITEVEDDSDAARKGLRPGDVIVEINQTKVTSPTEIEVKVQEALKLGRRSVLLQVQRGGDLNFVALRIKTS
jgi:serine protease Do